MKNKIMEEMRAQEITSEVESLDLESNPKWMRLKNSEDRLISIMLIVLGYLLIVGFIWVITDSNGSCSNRFEDYCI